MHDKSTANIARRLIGCVSGGFDIIHEGHIAYFKAAKQFLDGVSRNNSLVCILNDDNYLIHKRGYAALSLKTRKSLLESIRYIDSVEVTSDLNVASALSAIQPHYFFNSGDRSPGNYSTAESAACHEHNIREIYLDLPKVNSSSAIIAHILSAQSLGRTITP